MAESNGLVLIFLVAIAAPSTLAFSSLSWYCHRLVPRIITSSVTPCRYPCLVVSAHVHPHIIVQNEPDGTPCMIQNPLHHGRKIGMCRNNFCVQELPHKVLKRKKRFICIYSLLRMRKLKKQRNELEDQVERLRRQLASNRRRNMDGELSRGLGVDGNRGDEDLGGGSAGPGAGPDYGPENVPSIGRGTISSGFAGTGNAGRVMAEAGPFSFDGGRNSRREINTDSVPFNTNYGGGPIDNGDDGVAGSTQVRMRDSGYVGGTSDIEGVDSWGSGGERGVGGAAGYRG